MDRILTRAANKAILHASLDQGSLSVEKFSRWLRAICTILLSRNTAPDRLKSLGYIEQAISVLQEHGDDRDESDSVRLLFDFTVRFAFTLL